MSKALLIQAEIGVSPNQVLLQGRFQEVKWKTTLSPEDLIAEHDALFIGRITSAEDPILRQLRNSQTPTLLFEASLVVLHATEVATERASLLLASPNSLEVALPRFMFLMEATGTQGGFHDNLS